MFRLLSFIAKLFQLLPMIQSIIKGLNSLVSILKAEEEKNKEQKNPASIENKTETEQEKAKLNKSMFDEKKLNYLENKSYFLANVGTLKEFESLSEETKALAPDIFKKQFPKVVKEKKEKTSSNIHEEKTTKVVDEKHLQKKNELVNKVTFIVNKCGMASDFEKLSDEVKTMDPALFKEKSKDCKF